LTLDKLFKGQLAWAVLGSVFAIILGVFIWDISSEQAEIRVRGEQSTQNHIEYAEDRIDEKCLSLKGVTLRDCIHKEIESARDHARSKQDLEAQQKMALFTKIMGLTAIAGLALGAVSIGVIFMTLREMGRTNNIMRGEQRPWIKTLTEIELDVGEKGLQSFTFKYCAENIGKRPAEDVRYFSKIINPYGLGPQEQDILFDNAITGLQQAAVCNPIVFPSDRGIIELSNRFPINPDSKLVSFGVLCAIGYEDSLLEGQLTNAGIYHLIVSTREQGKLLGDVKSVDDVFISIGLLHGSTT